MTGPSPEEITKHHEYEESGVERVAFRKERQDITIHEPNPTWPAQYETLKQRIVTALGDKALTIHHVGSTSVPGMPAKAAIDIDVEVADPTDEASYISALEAADFHFLYREKNWHDHRFLVAYEPMCNLHVFGFGCPEVVRHLMFREWIVENDEERQRYIDAKRGALAAKVEGESGMAYNLRKEKVVRQILDRMFIAKRFK